MGYTVEVKTAISLPDDLFRTAERAAKRLGLSRSELYRRALGAFLKQHDATLVTAALDETYAEEAYAGGEERGLDPALGAMQAASLPREPW